MPTTPDPTTAPRHVLAAALTRSANTDGRRAAATLLAGYNDGELLDDPVIREHLHTTTTGDVMVRWHSIAILIDEPRASTGLGLSDAADGILSLACALTVGTPCRHLARTLNQGSERNAATVAAALAQMLFGTDLPARTTGLPAGGVDFLPTPGEPLDSAGLLQQRPVTGWGTATPTVATGGWVPLATRIRAAAANAVNIVTLPGLIDDVARILRDAGPDGATVAQIIARLRPAHDTDRNTVTAVLGALAADPDSTRGGYPTQPAPHGPYIWVSNGQPITSRDTDIREAVAAALANAGPDGATVEDIVAALDFHASRNEVYLALVALPGTIAHATAGLGTRWHHHTTREDTTSR